MKPRLVISDRFRTLLFGLTEGMLLAALVVNVRDAVREDAFFRQIATRAVADARTREDELLALVHTTHDMVDSLQRGVEDGTIEDISGLAHYRRILFNSVAANALYPNAKCGSYSGVLVELLKARGFPVRFGQMLDREDVNGRAHHIVAEAWLDGRWVICDPMYGLVFRGDDGRILGFDEIRRDWDRLKAQCPPDYDMSYDYRGFRRVNFGWLNPWLQKTPLAEWSVRVWLNEGAWMRSMLVAGLLVLVVGLHVWYERRSAAGREVAAVRPQTVSRGEDPSRGAIAASSPAQPVRRAAGMKAQR